jgi:isopropylmalate/homocitrate/citramalate synthase
MMSATPWKTDLWFTSPWNFAGEVTAKFQFPNDIKIHDITLRDGEQQAGIIFNRAEKIDIAKRLAAAGVHRIEAGMPAVSPDDEAAIKAIVDLNLDAEIFCFARCMVKDVELAKQCGVNGIVVEIPSSEHIIQYAYGWELQKAVRLSIEATLAAKEAGLYTVFFPIDASRAEMNWFLDLIEQIATEGHMDALAVVDTFGVCSPHAIPYLMKKIRERINKPLEPHFHDDFHLGVANTLMALAAGGSVAHTTVTGIGERAGNTPMEDLVLALLTMYNKNVGIKTEHFFELSKTIRKYADVNIPPNRPIVGEHLYNIESGIPVTWSRATGEEHQLELIPFRPRLVGQHPITVVMGKASGIDSVRSWIEDLGLTADEEQMMDMLAKIKARAVEKKSLLTKDDFKAIYNEVVSS